MHCFFAVRSIQIQLYTFTLNRQQYNDDCKFVNSVSQVQELHKKMTEETRRADNLAFEMKKLEEKHETVVKEKEVWEHFRCQKQELCFFFWM